MDGITYRIAAFDYYYGAGTVACNTHHVTLVPDFNMYEQQMNTTNTTAGAYAGSKMKSSGLTQAKTIIKGAFGAAHILSHRQVLPNATTDGYESGFAWYYSDVDLMTEHNVYGGKIFKNARQGTALAASYTIDKSQYPLFVFRPDLISNQNSYWLRDVASSTHFAYVNYAGTTSQYGAIGVFGVRPKFSIC